MNSTEAQDKIKEIQHNLLINNFRAEATRKLFHAACCSGDAVECVRLRDHMHTLLDAELDNHASIMHFAKLALK